MINNLDMNICTEVLKKNRCMSCKRITETNHYVVAEKSVIILCSDCLEKLCIHGIERLGYKEKKSKLIIKGKREKINERQFELQQEYKDFKDDVRLNTLQEIYYSNELLGGK